VIAGLILAAGAGTRFGDRPKLLAELGGRPLLEHAVRGHCDVGELERVVVVLGAFAAELQDRVEFGRAEVVVCEDWEDGQAASLRCGLHALAGAERVLVTLGDEPLISAEVIRRFVDQPGGARATYDGRPGHPVVLGGAQIAAALELTGDQGARGLLDDGPRLECADLCSGADVDTEADLEAIRALAGPVTDRNGTQRRRA
jgi:CTP:molybdopterin cytidylyltransferase MocA